MAQVTGADALTLLTALKEYEARHGTAINVTAGELADAMWLCQQGMPARIRDDVALAMTGRSAVVTRPDLPVPATPAGREDGTRPSPVPTDLPDLAGLGKEVPYILGWREDPAALPQARQLAQLLRPLRYDNRRVRPEGIDEEATARQIALTGIRHPVWRATRRRRLDLDLVLDLGGSGPLWHQLALESKAMLESTGAFRNVRYWTLDTDSADLPLQVGALSPEALTQPGPPLPSATVCQAPRRPVVLVLTDGTGRAWQDGGVEEHLRTWTTVGTVVLAQVLPAYMWSRTAMQAVPVTFYPADDGYHRGTRMSAEDEDLLRAGLGRQGTGTSSGDAGLPSAELARKQLRSATAIPVIELDGEWLRYWVSLLRGTQAGAVPGYALLIPPEGKPSVTAAAAPGTSPDAGKQPDRESIPAEQAEQLVPLSGEDRVQRFLVNASGDAIRLARLLSTVPVNLSIMRKIRHELLPRAKPSVIAEVLLGGLLSWTEPSGHLTSPGSMQFRWRRGVDEFLKARPGGMREFLRDKERVIAALARRDSTAWREHPVFIVAPASRDTTISAASAEPVTRGTLMGVAEEGDWAVAATPRQAAEAGRTVRVGIWGSTQSGRTTYLTVLAGVAGVAGWQSRPGRKEQWRVTPASQETQLLVQALTRELVVEKKFPDSTVPGQATNWSFILQRRRPEEDKRGRFRFWNRTDQVASITMQFQDRAGGEFDIEGGLPGAISYLEEADALLYFFDPVYDHQTGTNKGHSLDFFTAVDEHLGMIAAEAGRLVGRFLPQHIAVCIPKLDVQEVFEAARRTGCMDTDPAGIPWVPESKAKMYFENVCRSQRRPEADYLAASLRSRFHPDRISYHALSSIGYWTQPSGRLNVYDVCNAILPEDPGGSELPRERVRGEIRPLHVLDPLIALAERAGRDIRDRPGRAPAGVTTGVRVPDGGRGR